MTPTQAEGDFASGIPAHPLGEQAKTRAKAYYEGVAARVAESGEG